ITPMLAMADEAKRTGVSYELHYSGKSRSNMAYLDRVQRDHGSRSFLHISDEGTRLDIGSFKSRYSSGVQLLACGPDRLTTALLRDLDEWPEGSVRYETFSALNALDTTNNEEFVVELQSSGQEITVPKNMTLLEQLENHGHD